MKINKSMQKRAMNEYRDRRDYEQLLNKYFILCQRCTQLEHELQKVKDEYPGLYERYSNAQRSNFRLFCCCIVEATGLIIAAALAAYYAGV